MSLRQYIRRWTDRFILERKRITVMDQLASERELLDRIAALKAENEELRASAGGLARCMGLANMAEVSKAIQEHAPWNGHGICNRHREEIASYVTSIESATRTIQDLTAAYKGLTSQR